MQSCATLQMFDMLKLLGKYKENLPRALNPECKLVEFRTESHQPEEQKRGFELQAHIEMPRTMESHDSFCQLHGLGHAVKTQNIPLSIGDVALGHSKRNAAARGTSMAYVSLALVVSFFLQYLG